MTPDAIAAELLAAYGRADDTYHVLEARLAASCNFDPGLVLARTIVAASSSPATQRPRPRPAASPMWRVGGDLALCFVAVALPLACGLLLDRWIR